MPFLVCRTHHRTYDLVLASVISVVTFNVAYSACVVLGAVLLQTSPRRGLAGGRMEAFLRAMREVCVFAPECPTFTNAYACLD